MAKIDKALAKREQIISFIQSRKRTSLSPEASRELFTEVVDKVVALGIMRLDGKQAEELATLPASLGKARELFLEALYFSARSTHDDAPHMIAYKIPLRAASKLHEIHAKEGERLLLAGQHSAAREPVTRALALARYIDEELTLSISLSYMGIVEYRENNYPEAVAHYQEAISVIDRGVAKATKSSRIAAYEAMEKAANIMIGNIRSLL